jgi:hypothetical protein
MQKTSFCLQGHKSLRPQSAGFLAYIPYQRGPQEAKLGSLQQVQAGKSSTSSGLRVRIIISKVDSVWLKFGDEKHLKGTEIYCRRTRQNVLTGEVPPCYTAPDFHNTYTIVGLCCIDPSTVPLYYQIHDGTNDAESFSREIEIS